MFIYYLEQAFMLNNIFVSLLKLVYATYFLLLTEICSEDAKTFGFCTRILHVFAFFVGVGYMYNYNVNIMFAIFYTSMNILIMCSIQNLIWVFHIAHNSSDLN